MEPLHSLAILNEPAACKEGLFCRNSPSNSSASKCNDCRLSPGAPYFIRTEHWHPTNSKFKHPVLVEEKRHAKRMQALERQAERKAKDPARKARIRAAERAEKRTEQDIIKSTRNSGRMNRDGDHVLGSGITLDTKLQSTTENPVVHLHELDKVRADAKRSGQKVGGLAIKNKHGRGVIVFDIADYALLFGVS